MNQLEQLTLNYKKACDKAAIADKDYQKAREELQRLQSKIDDAYEEKKCALEILGEYIESH